MNKTMHVTCKKKDDEMFYNNREKKGFVEGIYKKWDMLDERELDNVPVSRGHNSSKCAGTAVKESAKKCHRWNE